MNDPHVITRKELYDLVWAEPLRSLAKRFDISDRGLAKKCGAYNIPRPPQGHWVRFEHGYKVVRTPLPETDDASQETIYFYPSSTSPDEKSTQAKSLLDEKQLAHAVEFEIPERVRQYNNNVRACRNYYKSRKSLDNYGRIVFDRDIANPGFKVTPKTFDRASLFLHGLMTLCCDLGWKFTETKNWGGKEKIAAVSHHGETLHFQLKEPVNQIEHKKEGRDSLWGPRYDYIATGKLELSIEGLYSSDIKRRWKDKGDILVESQLLSIAQSLSRGFEYCRLQTIERDLQRRVREQEAAERKEAQRLQQIENKRREHLFALSERFKQAISIRKLIDALKASEEDDGQLAAWLQWAEGVVSEIDPVVNAEAILERHDSIGKIGFYDW